MHACIIWIICMWYLLYVYMYCVSDILCRGWTRRWFCGGRGGRELKEKESRQDTCCVCRWLCSALLRTWFLTQVGSLQRVQFLACVTHDAKATVNAHISPLAGRVLVAEFSLLLFFKNWYLEGELFCFTEVDSKQSQINLTCTPCFFSWGSYITVWN